MVALTHFRTNTCYFKIVPESPLNGHLIRNDRPFYLRHFERGMYTSEYSTNMIFLKERMSSFLVMKVMGRENSESWRVPPMMQQHAEVMPS